MTAKRIVIAGLGDSGLLTAIALARKAPDADVVGISAKPGLVSGQELGWRISRPEHWAKHNWITFDRYRGLDRVRTVHGTMTGVDPAERTVSVSRRWVRSSQPAPAMVRAISGHGSIGPVGCGSGARKYLSGFFGVGT